MDTSGPGPPGPFSQPPALATISALRPSAQEVRKSPCSSICTIHSFIYNKYALCFFPRVKHCDRSGSLSLEQNQKPHLKELTTSCELPSQPEPLTLNLAHLRLLVTVVAISCCATIFLWTRPCCSQSRAEF